MTCKFTGTAEAETTRVVLELSDAEYGILLMILGGGIGAARARHDMPMFFRAVHFVNALNTGNPNFRPYIIPPEYEAETMEEVWAAIQAEACGDGGPVQ